MVKPGFAFPGRTVFTLPRTASQQNQFRKNSGVIEGLRARGRFRSTKIKVCKSARQT